MDKTKERGRFDEFINVTNKLKKIVAKAIEKKKYDKALVLISTIARLSYEMNQSYTDQILEEWLLRIGQAIFQNFPEEKIVTDDNVVVFYDGFGEDRRGLALIYLKALGGKYKVVYVTNESARNKIPSIEKIIAEHHGEIVFFKNNFNVSSSKEIYYTILHARAGHAFFYTTPWDTAAVIAFNCLKDTGIKRYLINLTDHAFWLGVHAFDYCIEFRDYGAYISNQYRQIPLAKLRLLPYYPIIDDAVEFEGYPFPFDETSQKLVFSGGALYKTLGAGNLYYQIVRHILESHLEVVFWYAGEGDDSQLKHVMQEFPGRVYHTKERKDLYQILRRASFYLNTYPIVGGLMFQYAAVAGTVPLTLKYDDEADGYLLGQEQLKVVYCSLEELYKEIDRLLFDQDYVRGKAERLKASVISSHKFSIELDKIMNGLPTGDSIELNPVDTKALKKTYLDRFSLSKLRYSMVSLVNLKYLIWIFPLASIKKMLKWIAKNMFAE